VPPRSRAFITATVASICGIVGLAVGGYGIDLLFLRPLDFELGTLVAMAAFGAIGWSIGAVVAWCRAGPRPSTSRVDVALFLIGAAFVLWLGANAANEIRLAHFGPMIDEIRQRNPTLPLIATAYLVDASLVALTLVALALTREAQSREMQRGRRTVP
jgi:hypothetical protein